MFLSPISMLALSVIAGTSICAAFVCLGPAIRARRARISGNLREAGGYVLVHRLAEGGMGEVWMARHRMLERLAAVKLIRSELLGRDSQRQAAAIKRFTREAKETAALKSVHTVDVYDFGVTADGTLYYAMELLDGMSAETLVRRFGPVGYERAVHLLRQICRSLGEAHERGLVHRDIKPANVFLCRQGGDSDFVKVLDFGLVRQAADPDSRELTGAGLTVGTPAYMAPEMALGESVDGRADIYAIGCVAYWLLTGRPVFTGETPVATALKHVASAPVRPSHLTEVEIPAALEELVLACLAKDPADRPQTAAELEARLAACVSPNAWRAENSQQWWQLHQPASQF
jgi:serine/threonine-protein kinase